MFRNSRSQIVLPTDIFPKLTLGAPETFWVGSHDVALVGCHSAKTTEKIKVCHTVHGGGGGTGIRGGSAPRSDPLLFHSLFLTEKESLSLLHQNVETSKNESASYIN